MFVAGAGIKGDGRSGLTALLACKPKEKEQDYGFVCWVPCLIRPFITVILGLLIILGGAAMCTVGYYSEYFSSLEYFNGTHNVTILDSFKERRIHLLTFLGPVIMGCGSFAIVIACVVVCEARDDNIKAVWERKRRKKEKQDAAREAFYDAVITKIQMQRAKIANARGKMSFRRPKHKHASNHSHHNSHQQNDSVDIESTGKTHPYTGNKNIASNGIRKFSTVSSSDIINETDSGIMSPDSSQSNDIVIHHNLDNDEKRTEGTAINNYFFPSDQNVGWNPTQQPSSANEIQRDISHLTDTDEFLDMFQRKLLQRAKSDDNLFLNERSVTKTDILLTEVDEQEDNWGDLQDGSQESGTKTSQSLVNVERVGNTAVKTINRMSSIPENMHLHETEHNKKTHKDVNTNLFNNSRKKFCSTPNLESAHSSNAKNQSSLLQNNDVIAQVSPEADRNTQESDKTLAINKNTLKSSTEMSNNASNKMNDEFANSLIRDHNNGCPDIQDKTDMQQQQNQDSKISLANKQSQEQTGLNGKDSLPLNSDGQAKNKNPLKERLTADSGNSTARSTSHVILESVNNNTPSSPNSLKSKSSSGAQNMDTYL